MWIVFWVFLALFLVSAVIALWTLPPYTTSRYVWAIVAIVSFGMFIGFGAAIRNQQNLDFQHKCQTQHGTVYKSDSLCVIGGKVIKR